MGGERLQDHRISQGSGGILRWRHPAQLCSLLLHLPLCLGCSAIGELNESGKQQKPFPSQAFPTCFSTFPSRPIMLGSSGSSVSAGPLVRSLSVIVGPRPTIWSTLAGIETQPPSVSLRRCYQAPAPSSWANPQPPRSGLQALSRADRGAVGASQMDTGAS